MVVNSRSGEVSVMHQSNVQSVTPKVSICIISFNQKHFIAQAIEGAVNQDYENFEVIVSDDGSTDGTAKIIAHWQSCYPERVVGLLNKENVGVTRNCNRALRVCKGDFITFLGGDDVLLPGKIAAQVSWFKEGANRVMCGHSVYFIHEDGTRFLTTGRSVLHRGVGPKKYIVSGHQLALQTLMYRASAIPSYGFEETIPIASDYLFCIEVLSNGGEYGYIEGVYSEYRRHANNLTLRHMDVVSDFEKTYILVAERMPQYREICMRSLVKHVIYFGGVRLLRMGENKAARRRFWAAIRKRPFFVKAWIRLFQTL